MSKAPTREVRNAQRDTRRQREVPVGDLMFKAGKLAVAREKYGISEVQFAELLVEQDHACAVCHTPFVVAEDVCVDHDHGTNQLRGLLCFNCNVALGHADDMPDRLREMAEYLERPAHAPRRFDVRLLSDEDKALAVTIVGSIYNLRRPDFVIAPNGEAYLYRWHVVQRNALANCYFHIQTADDPQRPLHDHYYDNQSVILAGGYVESMHEVVRSYGGQSTMRTGREVSVIRRPGDVIQRKAEEAHRLALPPGVPYSMSLFTTGPRRRMWGFHYPNGWRPYDDVTETHDGVSAHKESTP